MKRALNTLTWNDRFALIDHYTPTDKQIVDAFGVTQDELDTALQLRASGQFLSMPNVDVASYSSVFASTTEGIKAPKRTTTVTSTTTSVPPESASKRVKTPKKRGRKGTKILKAFTAVPTEPTSVNEFAATHSVSVAVLRQSKRFDHSGLGSVRVKKDKASGTLMIWREAAAG